MITNRSNEAPGLLPEIGVLLSPPSAVPISSDLVTNLLFDRNVLSEALRNNVYDVTRLFIPYTPGNPTVATGKSYFLSL